MKMRNKQSIKNFLRGAGFGLVIVFVLAFTVGCQKSDGGGSKKATTGPNYNNGYPGTPGCVNCAGGNGAFVGSGVGNSTFGGAQLALDFYLDGGNGVVAQGRFHVRGSVQCTSGYSIPGGDFNVTTSKAGYRNNELISDLNLTGANDGGTNIYIQNAKLYEVQPKYFSCDRQRQDYDELSAEVYIDSVGGYPCGAWVYVEMYNAPSVCGE